MFSIISGTASAATAKAISRARRPTAKPDGCMERSMARRGVAAGIWWLMGPILVPGRRPVVTRAGEPPRRRSPARVTRARATAMMLAPMQPEFVTILFTDLVGSASLFDRVGDERADALRRGHFEALRAAVAAHGGREVKSTGDGLMVVFGSAVAAVRCAIDMQRATAAGGDGLALRVGL